MSTLPGDIYPTPSEPGLYFARSGTYEWFNLIVDVTGKPPFMQASVWDRGMRGGGTNVIRDMKGSDITAWGPRIVQPWEVSSSKGE